MAMILRPFVEFKTPGEEKKDARGLQVGRILQRVSPFFGSIETKRSRPRGRRAHGCACGTRVHAAFGRFAALSAAAYLQS